MEPPSKCTTTGQQTGTTPSKFPISTKLPKPTKPAQPWRSHSQKPSIASEISNQDSAISGMSTPRGSSFRAHGPPSVQGGIIEEVFPPLLEHRSWSNPRLRGSATYSLLADAESSLSVESLEEDAEPVSISPKSRARFTFPAADGGRGGPAISSTLTDVESSSDEVPAPAAEPEEGKKSNILKRLIGKLEELDMRIEEHFSSRKAKSREKADRKRKQVTGKNMARDTDRRMRAQIRSHREREKRRAEDWKREVKRTKLEEKERVKRMNRALRENKRLDRAPREKTVSTLSLGTFRVHAGIAFVGGASPSIEHRPQVEEMEILGRQIYADEPSSEQVEYMM